MNLCLSSLSTITQNKHVPFEICTFFLTPLPKAIHRPLYAKGIPFHEMEDEHVIPHLKLNTTRLMCHVPKTLSADQALSSTN